MENDSTMFAYGHIDETNTHRSFHRVQLHSARFFADAANTYKRRAFFFILLYISARMLLPYFANISQLQVAIVCCCCFFFRQHLISQVPSSISMLILVPLVPLASLFATFYLPSLLPSSPSLLYHVLHISHTRILCN